MNMRLPRYLRDSDPALSNVPINETPVEIADVEYEWMTEELENVERQAFNTTESERQWVYDHLGHTMNVHRVHYRQTSDVLERIDVAKVLLIQDLGLVAKYRGKTIQDIQIEDLYRGTEDPKPETPTGDSPVTRVLQIMEEDGEEEVVQFQDEEADSTDEDEEQPKRKKASTRQRWTEEEVTELQSLFDEDLRICKLPGQKKIEGLMNKSKRNDGVIWRRKRDTIKKKLSNMMVKRRREMC